MATTTTKTCKSKLSVRKDTLLKKPSSSSTSLYKARAKTVLEKAYELSELCGVDVCIIFYDGDGNLVKTWPENDEAQVKAMAERFSRLSEQERNKKSTNLSLFLNKKMMDEKKASLKANDNKFSKKVFVIEDSLESRLLVFQERIRFLQSGQDHDGHGVVSTVLGSCSSVINVDQYQPNLMNHQSTLPITSSSSSSLNHPSNLSILLFNHDNGTFTKLASPGFEQPVIPFNQDLYGTNYMDLLLADQGMGSCNNFDLPISTIPPPMMQTQTSMFQQFDHQFMQTQQGIPYNQAQSSDYPTMIFS